MTWPFPVFANPKDNIQQLIEKSFLSDDMKQTYRNYLEDKVKRLNMIPAYSTVWLVVVTVSVRFPR